MLKAIDIKRFSLLNKKKEMLYLSPLLFPYNCELLLIQT
jgi:hypothetical protein